MSGRDHHSVGSGRILSLQIILSLLLLGCSGCSSATAPSNFEPTPIPNDRDSSWERVYKNAEAFSGRFRDEGRDIAMTDVTMIPAQFTLNGAKPKLVAVGYDADKAAVWTSDDGYVWKRIHERDAEFSELESQRINAVSSVDGKIVAVGDGKGFEYCDMSTAPLFWYSTDLGESWVRVPLDTDAMCVPGGAYALDVDIGTVNGVVRAVAVGGKLSRGGITWYSDIQDDGFSHWTRLDVSLDGYLTAISAGPDGHAVATSSSYNYYYSEGGSTWVQGSNLPTSYYFGGAGASPDLARYPAIYMEEGVWKVYSTTTGWWYFVWWDHSKDREFAREFFTTPPTSRPDQVYCAEYGKRCEECRETCLRWEPVPTPTIPPDFCREKFLGQPRAIIIMDPSHSIENIYMLGVTGTDAWAGRFSVLNGPGCQLENFESDALEGDGTQMINAAVLYEPTTIIAVGGDRWSEVKSEAAAVWRFGPQMEHPVVPEISPESIQSICQPIHDYIDRVVELASQNQQALESGDEAALGTLEAPLNRVLADAVLQLGAIPLDIETREAVDALVAAFAGSESDTSAIEDVMEVYLDVCFQQ